MWLLIAVGLLILWGLSSSGEKAQNSAHYSRIKDEGTFDPLEIGLDEHFIQDFNENWVEKRYVPEKYVPYIADVLDLDQPYETVSFGFDHRDKDTNEPIYKYHECSLATARSFPECWANEQLSSMGFKPKNVYEYNRFEYNPYASFFADLNRVRNDLQEYHEHEIARSKASAASIHVDFYEQFKHAHETKPHLPKPTDPIVTEYGIQLRDAYLNKIQNGRFAKAVDTVEDLAGFWVWAFERMGAKKIEEYDVSYCFRDDERGIRITGMELKPVVMKCYHKRVEPDKRNLWNNEHEGEFYDAELSSGLEDPKVQAAALPEEVTFTSNPIPDSPSDEEYKKVKSLTKKRISRRTFLIVLIDLVLPCVDVFLLLDIIHKSQVDEWQQILFIVLTGFIVALSCKIWCDFFRDVRYFLKFRKAYRKGKICQKNTGDKQGECCDDSLRVDDDFRISPAQAPDATGDQE